MISVTIAANGRNKKCVGAHLRAYGSGRLSICDLERETMIDKIKDERKSGYAQKLFEKCCGLVFALLQYCFPYIWKQFAHPNEKKFTPTKFNTKVKSTCIPNSPAYVCNETAMLLVFSYLDGTSIIACERVCKEWKKIINNNIKVLPKQPIDQLRILFDEGEAIIYPIDEKRCPVRYKMPSLQILARRLRHLKCQSLFIRGLIPIESTPVLRALCALNLSPQQIYIIWSKFCPESISLLENFLEMNKESLVDVGLEECSPPQLLTDNLLLPIINGLTSLRLWNNGKAGIHGITNKSIHHLASSIRSGTLVETVDLASCNLSVTSIADLILAWISCPRTDLSVSLNYCPYLYRDTLFDLLASRGLRFSDGKLRKDGFMLTVYC